MNKEDMEFLVGKGHICEYCKKKGKCDLISRIQVFAARFAFIDRFSIEVYECRKFEKDENIDIKSTARKLHR